MVSATAEGVAPSHAGRVAAIEMRGVSKRFRSRQRLPFRVAPPLRIALHPFDLVVAQGETCGVIGMNGSGKSTLIRILSTLLLPDSGTACVFGHDVVREAAVVRRHINRVSVEAAFLKELSPWENLLFSTRLYAADDGARARVETVLARLGLPPRALDRPMRQLSRGQQQKVAIARSLLTSPALLLMDEPTTGLDPRSRREVQEIIAGVRCERDVTVLLSTHDLTEAETLCDRVVVLDRGRLIADAPPRDLLVASAGATTLEDAFLELTGRRLDDDAEDDADGAAVTEASP